MLVSQKPQKDVVRFRFEFFQTCDRTFDSIDDDIDEVGKSIRFPVYWQWPLLQSHWCGHTNFEAFYNLS